METAEIKTDWTSEQNEECEHVAWIASESEHTRDVSDHEDGKLCGQAVCDI